jgi:hypothetical protein
VLDPEVSIFGDKFTIPSDDTSRSLHATNGSEDVTIGALQKIMSSFIDVCNRQLADFLPKGIYSTKPSEDLRSKMKHCKLTNLVGENEFGDLDFSQYRRRHASLFFHSGVQMVKQNKTISVWLESKSPEDQSRLLNLARDKSKNLRQRHKTAEREIYMKRKEKLEEERKKREELLATKAENKKKLINAVKDHGGPCKNLSDIQRVLAQCHSKTLKLNVIKNEIRYLKIVLGMKDDRLIFGKKIWMHCVTTCQVY